MTEQYTMTNLYNNLYFTVQQMKQFVRIFEEADRRDYVTEEEIRIMRQALDSIVVDYEDTMRALAEADENIG
jgi:hypothetical protein